MFLLIRFDPIQFSKKSADLIPIRFTWGSRAWTVSIYCL